MGRDWRIGVRDAGCTHECNSKNRITGDQAFGRQRGRLIRKMSWRAVGTVAVTIF